jgi:hypothetical protein
VSEKVARGGAIEVNPHALHSFGVALGGEVHGNVKPHAQRLTITFADGVAFGAHNPSADLQAAASAYHDCLAGVTQQLAAVVDAVTVLADSAQTIASRYATSDALAHAKANDVLNVLYAPKPPAPVKAVSRYV